VHAVPTVCANPPVAGSDFVDQLVIMVTVVMAGSAAPIDDALTTLINEGLFLPGWVSGGSMLEQIFAGVALASVHSPLTHRCCSTATVLVDTGGR